MGFLKRSAPSQSSLMMGVAASQKFTTFQPGEPLPVNEEGLLPMNDIKGHAGASKNSLQISFGQLTGVRHLAEGTVCW